VVVVRVVVFVVFVDESLDFEVVVLIDVELLGPADVTEVEVASTDVVSVLGLVLLEDNDS
jgi:hypothetical protein